MPHLRSKSHRWRAVGIILREGHYCIEVASVTAKNKSLPLDENPGTFFHEHAKIHSMHKPSDKRENHTSTRTHKKTHVRLHIHAHVWHTHAYLYFWNSHKLAVARILFHHCCVNWEKGRMSAKILFGPHGLNPMFGWQIMISKSERTFFFSTEKEVQYFSKHYFSKHIHSS